MREILLRACADQANKSFNLCILRYADFRTNVGQFTGWL
jgi:hypothetical protein